MNKLTKEQIEEIRIKYSHGLTLKQLAEEYGVSHSTISYHIDKDKHKEKYKRYWINMPIEKRKIAFDRIKNYQREYRRNRYQNDEEYRNKQREYQRDYKRNNNKTSS